MDSQMAILLGALIASVKGLGLVAIGAGIAWWRARRRVRELEAQLAAAAVSSGDADLARLEQGLDYLMSQVRALADEQRAIVQRLPAGGSPPSSQEQA